MNREINFVFGRYEYLLHININIKHCDIVQGWTFWRHNGRSHLFNKNITEIYLWSISNEGFTKSILKFSPQQNKML